MSAIDPTATLGELVLEQPGRADVFERLGFDYCCRGGRTLAEACVQHDLDVKTVATVLASYALPGSSSGHNFDGGASTAEICEHIVAAHHDRLRRDLPRLADTLQTVVRVHGADDASLHDLARVYDALRTELETHMEREEESLFPACLAVEAGKRPLDDALLAELEHEHEHADVGEALLVLRELAGDFRTEQARCGTHRSLLDGLRELEHDLHLHIHEENNVLFPRIRGRRAAA